MSYEYIEVESQESGVVILTINNPENLNALGAELSRELKAALEAFEADAPSRVLVLRGAGRAFSSGGNLRDMRDSLAGDPGKYMDDLTREVYGAINVLMSMNKPVIAAVHGFAYGAAFNMVMACDLAVAARGAVFCESFIKLGLIPGGHATTLLPRIVGIRRALDLCLTGREVSAEEALALGIINKVAAPESLMDETLSMAAAIAQGPPAAIAETKKLLRAYYRGGAEEHAELERRTQIRMARSDDFKEGVTAFFEKRRPKFSGK